MVTSLNFPVASFPFLTLSKQQSKDNFDEPSTPKKYLELPDITPLRRSAQDFHDVVAE